MEKPAFPAHEPSPDHAGGERKYASILSQILTLWVAQEVVAARMAQHPLVESSVRYYDAKSDYIGKAFEELRRIPRQRTATALKDPS